MFPPNPPLQRPIAVITVISGLAYKRGERVGQVCFVLTCSLRLHAFLNKRIFDRRFNSKNSYSLTNN